MSLVHKIALSDFRSHGSRVFAGRERGEEVRRETQLDGIDADEEQSCEVSVPPDTFSVNQSFFLGMFGPSVRVLGEEGFRRKYVFVGKNISRVLDEGIREALNPDSPL